MERGTQTASISGALEEGILEKVEETTGYYKYKITHNRSAPLTSYSIYVTVSASTYYSIVAITH